jgi:hypothetical protein
MAAATNTTSPHLGAPDRGNGVYGVPGKTTLGIGGALSAADCTDKTALEAPPDRSARESMAYC